MKQNTPQFSTSWFKEAVLAIGLIGLTAVAGHAQVSLNTNGLTYTQNFNSLTAATTEATTGYFSSNNQILGWYISSANTSGGAVNSTLSARGGDGTSTSNAFFEWGNYGNSDRALGMFPGSGGIMALGARFQNDTASALTGATVSYLGEQWRSNSASTAGVLLFSYAITTTSVTPFSDTDPLNTAFTWNSVSTLDFTAPIVASAGRLDGSVAPNQTAKGPVNFSFTLNPGQEIMFRWLEQSNLAGLAVDDFAVTFVPEPSTFAMLLGGTSLLAFRRRRRKQS